MSVTFFGKTALFALAVGLLAAPGGRAEEGDHPIWALRDHFTITQNGVALRYAVDTAQWALGYESVDLIGTMTVQVVLGDGTVVNTRDTRTGEARREAVSNRWGEGNLYGTVHKLPQSLELEHHFTTYKKRPFFTVHMQLTNRGETPVAVRELHPMWGSAVALRPEGPDLVFRNVCLRGGSPVYTARSESALSVLYRPPGVNRILGMAVLHAGDTDCALSLAPYGGGWQWRATTVFDPPVTLAPGESVKAAPLWLSFAEAFADTANRTHLWSQYLMSKDAPSDVAPRQWVSTAADVGSDDFAAQVRDWTAGGLRYVLVPGSWQRAGSPWLKDMKGMARDLSKVGMFPGLTLDPARVSEHVQPGVAWAFAEETGTTWLDLREAPARAVARRIVEDARGWGFRFFAITPPEMPGAALERFGLTRPQADALAFAFVREMVPDLPVVPTSMTTLTGNAAQWRDAAASIRTMNEYSLAPGPVRFDVTGMAQLPPDLASALAAYEGPIEIVGTIPPKMRRALMLLLDARTAGAAP